MNQYEVHESKFRVVIKPKHSSDPKERKEFTLPLFNTVAHPRSEDLDSVSDVPVEENEGTIKVAGGTIEFNKERLINLAAIPQKANVAPSSRKLPEFPDSPVIKTTNKNAYEIRADVLHMAIDWAKVESSTENYQKPSDEKLLALAKKFYQFVENRR